jgi:hypothetical protein
MERTTETIELRIALTEEIVRELLWQVDNAEKVARLDPTIAVLYA